jgi:hypothetical protein
MAAARKGTLPTRANAPLQIAEQKLRNQGGTKKRLAAGSERVMFPIPPELKDGESVARIWRAAIRSRTPLDSVSFVTETKK